MSLIQTYKSKLNRSTQDSVALLIVRLVMGSAFILHGFGKIQAPFEWMGPDAPVPGIFQALAALSEFGGGIALILGAVVPLAALGIFFTMLVATFTHMSKGDPFVGYTGSYELASVYASVALLFILVGPGKYSLDNVLCKNK
jgi:putative oxidoreductase